MITTQATVTTGDRGGYAMPVVIFVLVLLGVLGSASLQTTRDELLSAKATSRAQAALFAAEAGLSDAVANWNQAAMDTLLANVGDSVVNSWSTLANSCEYQTVFRRLNATDDGNDQFFSITSTGRSPGLDGGAQRVAGRTPAR